MQFRKDINGLRAIAVISVILFHFKESWMPGGFAGVDVFFVISGFLMTGIIFRGLEQNNFSIWTFYVARANRIIPALATLCVVLLIFGWFYLPPIDYRLLGKHVASSIGFLSNVFYWKEASYFDASSHQKWLLHTWSLSAEWQFYIVYPLALVAMKKSQSIEQIKKNILLGTIVFFILSVFLTYNSPKFSYYMLPTRAWEMLMGAIAYLYPFTLQDKMKKGVERLGLALIVGSYFLISRENAWPGYLAMFPVLGAFFIIQAQRNDSIITSNLVFQKLGSWSYSIYLWHWPLVVAIYYFSLNEIYIYIGLGLSVLLGFLSYTYIEKIKFEKSFSRSIDYLKCKPIHMALILTIIGVSAYVTYGFEGHYHKSVVVASKESLNKNPHKCKNKLPCFIGNKDHIKAIVLGDSHAEALATAVADSFDLKNNGIIVFTSYGCPFILNVKVLSKAGSCQKRNIKIFEYLETHYATLPVFWIARTGAYLYGQSNPERINSIRDTQPLIYFTRKYDKAESALHDELKLNLSATIKKLLVKNPVYIVQPTPEMRRNVPRTLAKNLLLNIKNDDLSREREHYFKRNKRIRHLINEVATTNNIQVLDPALYLCQTGRCMAQLKGRPLYFDTDHMSEYGNKVLAPMFAQAIKKQ